MWADRMFRREEINEILLAFGQGLSLISFILWTIRSRDTVYLWFSGMCLSWSVVTLHMAALALIVFRVAIVALRERRLQAIIVSTAVLLQILLFSHNVYLMFFANSARWEGNIFYAHFGIPVLFMIFVATLLMRFASALTMAETLNRELENKVESSRQLIERNFAARRALEINQAAEQERLKIYRDLHDDVGSKLLSIVHADRDSKLGHMARSALESLRQAVARLGPRSELDAVHPCSISDNSLCTGFQSQPDPQGSCEQHHLSCKRRLSGHSYGDASLALAYHDSGQRAWLRSRRCDGQWHSQYRVAGSGTRCAGALGVSIRKGDTFQCNAASDAVAERE